MTRFRFDASSMEYDGNIGGLSIAVREFKKHLSGLRKWHDLRATNAALRERVAELERRCRKTSGELFAANLREEGHREEIRRLTAAMLRARREGSEQS